MCVRVCPDLTPYAYLCFYPHVCSYSPEYALALEQVKSEDKLGGQQYISLGAMIINTRGGCATAWIWILLSFSFFHSFPSNKESPTHGMREPWASEDVQETSNTHTCLGLCSLTVLEAQYGPRSLCGDWGCGASYQPACIQSSSRLPRDYCSVFH